MAIPSRMAIRHLEVLRHLAVLHHLAALRHLEVLRHLAVLQHLAILRYLEVLSHLAVLHHLAVLRHLEVLSHGASPTHTGTSLTTTDKDRILFLNRGKYPQLVDPTWLHVKHIHTVLLVARIFPIQVTVLRLAVSKKETKCILLRIMTRASFK